MITMHVSSEITLCKEQIMLMWMWKAAVHE